MKLLRRIEQAIKESVSYIAYHLRQAMRDILGMVDQPMVQGGSMADTTQLMVARAARMVALATALGLIMALSPIVTIFYPTIGLYALGGSFIGYTLIIVNL